MAPLPGEAHNVLRGLLRLARFNRSGFALFASSVPAFLSSLAPLLAFPLVGGSVWLLNGGGLDAVSELLVTACALLAPAVLSHGFARYWGREPAWLRYAVAFNWCQWAIPLAAIVLLLVLAGLMAMGLSAETAGILAVVGLVAYGLALHWFLARHGLQLSVLRAVLLVVGVNLATSFLVLAPRLLQMAIGGSQD